MSQQIPSPAHGQALSQAHGRTQIFQVSTLYGTATLAAALDAGQFGPRAEARRILLVSNNAEIPETSVTLGEMSGFDTLATRFDSVISWNDAIRPFHPSAWSPRPDDTPLWQGVFRDAWDIRPGPVELAVESIQVSPARALVDIFSESAVHVYADGLMSYGPTRDRLPGGVACRVQRLLHLDLVPGLRPLLLSEYGVEPELVPDDFFRKILDEITVAAADDELLNRVVDEAPGAVILGQYLAALNILTADEEEDLHVRMLRGAAALGHKTVVFKPHPTAPARYSKALDKAAAEAGVRLTVLDSPLLAETLYGRCRPALVVGCFSTAMLTAAQYYGVPIARVGTELVLERLTPYQNSNRVPLTIVDFAVPALDGGIPGTVPEAVVEKLTPLLRAVGYCMQADSHPRLRDSAVAWLRANLDETTAHYFKRRRLGALGLPGAGATGPAQRLRRNPAARRAVRTVRKAVRRGR